MPNPHVLRRANLLLAFQTFAQTRLGSPDSPGAKGIEQAFAEHLQIRPSAWSMFKTGSRPVGDKLARQFEAVLGRPPGWLDEEHGEPGITPAEQHLMALALAASRRTNAAGRRRLLQLLKDFA